MALFNRCFEKSAVLQKGGKRFKIAKQQPGLFETKLRKLFSLTMVVHSSDLDEFFSSLEAKARLKDKEAAKPR